ncbi:7-cyano-7-deazaguanine synthase [Hydrogenobaculum acidophilum]
MKVITLVSSGFDSISLLNYYINKSYSIYPLYVKSGFKWEKDEINHLKDILSYIEKRYKDIAPLEIKTIQNDFSEEFNKRDFIEDEDVEIPFRNLDLLISALKYAYSMDVKNIAIGIMGLVAFKDNTENFIKAINNLFSMYGDYKVETPFLGMSKKDVFDKYFIKELFDKAFCCMNPINGKECGICSKCKEKELVKGV